MSATVTRAVLLHGFTGSSRSWPRSLLGGLERAGIEPLSLDLPGHGRRKGAHDPASFTLDATLSSIDEAVDDGGALIGYSMGGRIALHYAVRNPDRVSRLVLESASPGLATAEERARRRASDTELAEQIEAEGIESFVERWTALPLFDTQRGLDEATRRAIRAGRMANDPASLAAALRGLGTGSLPSLWDALEALRVPTLLLTGASDGKFVDIAERMSTVLPESHHLSVPGAGHAVHIEARDAWVEAVSRFLTSTP